MRRRTWLKVLVAAVVVVAAYRSVVFVDETQWAIVTLFGRPLRTLEEAGLYFKMPYQSVLRVDKRLRVYDPRPSEFLAKEKKTVDLDVFVCWRVGDPQAFLERSVDYAGAEARLHDIVWAELRSEIGNNPLDALVSTDPTVHCLDDLMERVAARCAERAREACGIEVVDVRLKRIAVPQQVRDSVFERMRAERARMARRYRAEGEKEAMTIKATADKERRVILAQAYNQAEKIRGEAEAKAIELYAAAHKKDPEFYELLRTLEAYKKFLDEKTTLLLSADSELFKYLRGRGEALEGGKGTR